MITAIVVYLAAMLLIGLWAQTKIDDHEDFIVAGRRLPLGLSTFTLLATWFGAGTLLTATDEIYAEGVGPALLEPYGAGCALLIAGLFFARPLWEMKLCTVTDFYKRKFGPRVEPLCVAASVLSFAGWIAVQLVALAGVFEIVLGLPASAGIALIALVAMGYTLLGGMWSVTITDFVQLIIIIIGIFILGYEVFSTLGDGGILTGVQRTAERLEPGDLVLIPSGSALKLASCLNLFLIASLGNIPSQDLGQRIFAAKSGATARAACFAAGALYIGAGTVPVALGLAAKVYFPEIGHSVIPALAKSFLSPALSIIFVLAVISAVLSTIDSAILAPATTLANNGLRHLFDETKVSTLRLCHISVVAITALSTAIAYSGEKTYTLLEQAYAIGLAGFFAPLVIGLLIPEPDQTGGILSITVGLAVWPLEFFIDSDVPFALIGALAGFAVYFIHGAVSGTLRAGADA